MSAVRAIAACWKVRVPPTSRATHLWHPKTFFSLGVTAYRSQLADGKCQLKSFAGRPTSDMDRAIVCFGHELNVISRNEPNFCAVVAFAYIHIRLGLCIWFMYWSVFIYTWVDQVEFQPWWPIGRTANSAAPSRTRATREIVDYLLLCRAQRPQCDDAPWCE